MEAVLEERVKREKQEEREKIKTQAAIKMQARQRKREQEKKEIDALQKEAEAEAEAEGAAPGKLEAISKPSSFAEALSEAAPASDNKAADKKDRFANIKHVFHKIKGKSHLPSSPRQKRRHNKVWQAKTLPQALKESPSLFSAHSSALQENEFILL